MSSPTKTHITLVKKIMADGRLCSECCKVSELLIQDGLLEEINYVAIADSKNTNSEGMLLAHKYKLKRTPFFIVEDQDGLVHTFEDYFAFKHFIEKHLKSKSLLPSVA